MEKACLSYQKKKLLKIELEVANICQNSDNKKTTYYTNHGQCQESLQFELSTDKTL